MASTKIFIDGIETILGGSCITYMEPSFFQEFTIDVMDINSKVCDVSPFIPDLLYEF